MSAEESKAAVGASAPKREIAAEAAPTVGGASAPTVEAWRLFFPSALLLAPVNVLAWLAARDGLIVLPGIASAAWHGRELVFGYAFAVMAGYLLRPLPLSGLLALWGLWLAGRLLVLLPPATLPALVEFAVAAAFPLLIAALGAHRFGAVKRARNLPFPLVMVVLGVAAGAAFAVQTGLLPYPLRSPAALAASLVALLIMIMGGRLVPTATVGALRARGLIVRIPVRPAVELALFLLVLGWVASDAFLGPRLAGALALAAAAVLALTMSGWHLARILHDPLVWPLHLGFAWLLLGCVLLGLERLGFITTPDAGALHALTAGGIGTVTLVMMMRVTRYRAGLLLASPARLHGLYLVMALAVAIRVGGGWLLPQLHEAMLWASAIAWTLAYLGSAALVIGAALRPRLH